MVSFFDPYEVRARLAPSIIIALPPLTTLFSLFPEGQQSWRFFVGSGLVSLALLYGFTFIVRHKGRAIEAKLWRSWGGPPSMQFLRWRDKRLSKEVKLQIHQAVRNTCGIDLPSETQEKDEAKQADRLIEDAFQQVREFLRLKDKEGLWLKHNAEYGFARNLLGSRNLFVLFCLAGILTCILFAQYKGDDIVNVGTVMNSLYLIVWIPVGWLVLPRTAKEIAERYAERAWLTFLALSKTPASEQ